MKVWTTNREWKGQKMMCATSVGNAHSSYHFFFLKNLFKENVQAQINQKFLRTNPAVSQLRASLVYFAHLFL